MKFNNIHKSPFFVALILLAFYGLIIFAIYSSSSRKKKDIDVQHGIISGAVKGYKKERGDVDIPGGVDYGSIGSFERSKRDKTIMELTGGFGGFG